MQKIIFVIIFLFISGCVSTTTIKTKPEGAVIFISEYQTTCTSPCSHSDKKISGSVTGVVISKDGYKTLNTTIKKDYLSTRDVVMSLLINPVQLFYWYRYPDSYTFELTKTE